MIKIQKLFLTLAVALAVAGRTEARIGDKEAEIHARYGDPIAQLTAKTRDPGAVKCYFWKGYIVAVTYLGGRSAREIFTKANNSHLTAAEIDAVLKANAGGLKWQAEEIVYSKGASPGVRQWRTSEDGSRIAFYDSETRALFISTQRFVELVKATQRQITLSRGNPVAGPAGARPMGGTGVGALKNAATVLDKGAMMARPGQSKPSASPSN